MKKLIFSLAFLAACLDSNITTNNSSRTVTTISAQSDHEQLDCHDPALDICVEPDYSKDICEVTVIDIDAQMYQ